MLQILVKKLNICLAGMMLMLTCTACKADVSYRVGDYLEDLSLLSGIGEGKNAKEDLQALCNWGICMEKDTDHLDEELTQEYLCETIARMIGVEEGDMEVLKGYGLIPQNAKKKDRVDIKTASETIEKAIYRIDHPDINNVKEFEYRKMPLEDKSSLEAGDLLLEDNTFYVMEEEGDSLIRREASYDDVFAKMDLEEGRVMDFTDAVVIPYGEEENSSYFNERYRLLSSNNHVFNKEGFRISYTLNRSGIDIHVSKNENGLNVYLDISINNVKPYLQWHSEKKDMKNCFFAISFNTSEKLGVSSGKYKNYHLKFKDLDPSSFLDLLHSMIEPQRDDQEASIPICKIKLPIPDVPTAYIVLDVTAKFHASGKAEFVLNTKNQIGFETKNGQARFINEGSHDIDSILQASAKAALGLNAGLEIVKTKLCDVELDGGVKGLVRSTLHLYDDEGGNKSVGSELPYSGLEDLAEGNPDVLVCGDVSLYWLMDLIINTSSSKMHDLGFSRSFSIMNEDDQVFHNLHHIENGHFVKKCTRNGRQTLVQMEEVKLDRIVLNSYAEVLKKNETHMIEIRSLPQGYDKASLSYSSSDPSIASVDKEGNVTALKEGSARIEVKTDDDRYQSYVNILVSTG